MFPAERQAKLDPILAELKKIPGIVKVAQDDFDSTSIRVVCYLDDCNSRAGSLRGNKPFRFAQPIRSTKAAIKKSCKGTGLLFTNTPVLQYESSNGEKVKDGYDSDHISIDLDV